MMMLTFHTNSQQKDEKYYHYQSAKMGVLERQLDDTLD